MAKKNTQRKNQNPWDMELLDLLNETGGTLTIKYHTASFTFTKEQLQTIRDNNIPTDVMTCVMFGLSYAKKDADEVEAYLMEALACGAAPTIEIEAEKGKGLNITGDREDNPMLDQLVQAVQNQ